MRRHRLHGTARHGTGRSALHSRRGTRAPVPRARRGAHFLSSGFEFHPENPLPRFPHSREIYTYLSTYNAKMTSVLPLGCKSPALSNVLNASPLLLLVLIWELSDSGFSQLKSYYGRDVMSRLRQPSTKAAFLYGSVIRILRGYGSRNGQFVLMFRYHSTVTYCTQTCTQAGIY